MLHSFGDSFAFGHCEGMELPNFQLSNNYTSYVAEYFNVPFKNYGMPGASHLDILNSITAKLVNIKKGDIVLIAGTSNIRYQVPTKYLMPIFKENRKSKYGVGIAKGNQFDKTTGTYLIGGGQDREQLIEQLQRLLPVKLSLKKARAVLDAYETIADNISLPFDDYYHLYFQDWILSFHQYFEQIGVKCITWDSFWWRIINEEVPSKCSCGHWDESGHKVFSNYIINGLKNNIPIMRKGNGYTLDIDPTKTIL